VNFLKLKNRQINLPEQLKADIKEVEKRLEKSCSSNNPLMGKITRDAVLNGGKRLRPILIMAMFRALNGADENNAYLAATALELIHTASLIHDDIMDQSARRRGAVTAFHEHGLNSALLAGDFLFVEGYGLASLLPNKVVDSVVISLKRLGEGQLSEDLVNMKDIDFKTYQRIITDKTAYLFWGSCRIGTILADADQDWINRMSTAGMDIGIAFQYVDDILDIAGDSKLTGKPVGTDFLMGKMTLPYFKYVEEYGPLPELRTPETFRQILPRLSEDRLLDKSRAVAREYTEKATSVFKLLPNREISDFLVTLCNEMLQRIH